MTQSPNPHITPDPRITPARPDLAAARLRGKVTAARYVEGTVHTVTAATSAMHTTPEASSMRISECLAGEHFIVYEQAGDWAWGQCDSDGYVGYVAAANLQPDASPASHIVIQPTSHLYARADLKSPVTGCLHLGCRIAVEGAENGFAATSQGWIFAKHLRGIDAHEPNFIANAKRFLGRPYLWGGRSGLGLDCSGLVQQALHLAGLACPRDSDQQAACLGQPVKIDVFLQDPQHGDLVFWPGHVGFYLQDGQFLHANAFDMAVSIHRFADVAARAETMDDTKISAVRRLNRPR